MKVLQPLLLALLVTLANVLPTAAAEEPAAPERTALTLPWYDGVINTVGYDWSCPPVSLYEIRVQGYAGYTLRPPNLTPAVGELFYAHLVLSHPGNPCMGSAVGGGIMLPPGVSLAISAGNPVFCFARGPSGQFYDLSTDSGYGCPQTLTQGLEGSLALIPPRGGLVINGQKSYAWGMAQGTWLEFMVPLQSTTVQAGNDNLMFRVNPDIGVVGYPGIPLLVNGDVIFRTAIEDNVLRLSI